MAHVAKYKAPQVAAMGRHYTRQNEHYANENIDPVRAGDNYALTLNKHPETLIKERLATLERTPRKDAVVMVDWVITLPEDVKKEDQKKFFTAAYDFCGLRYGVGNTLNAVVHMDETTPHMHYSFMPITEDGRLSAKDILSRVELKTFHTALGKAVCQELGYKVSIELSDEKKAKKALSSVPHEQLDAARQALEEELNQATAEAQKKLTELQNELVQTSKAVEDKRAVLATLERQLEVLKTDVQDFLRDYLQAPFARIKELIAEFGAEKTQDLIEEKEKTFVSRFKDMFVRVPKPESVATSAATGGLTDDVKPIPTPQERVAVEQPKAVPARKPSFATAKAAAVGARAAEGKDAGAVKRHEQER